MHLIRLDQAVDALVEPSGSRLQAFLSQLGEDQSFLRMLEHLEAEVRSDLVQSSFLLLLQLLVVLLEVYQASFELHLEDSFNRRLVLSLLIIHVSPIIHNPFYILILCLLLRSFEHLQEVFQLVVPEDFVDL